MTTTIKTVVNTLDDGSKKLPTAMLIIRIICLEVNILFLPNILQC